ncbi:MAG: hypothetical protein ACLVJH_19095 [Faecalibacterium prausnitzii]
MPEVQRKGGVSSVSSSGLVEKLVQVQLNQDKIDEINAKLAGTDPIPSWLKPAPSWKAPRHRSPPDAGIRKAAENFGGTVSNSVMSQMSTEGRCRKTVRAQAQALLKV